MKLVDFCRDSIKSDFKFRGDEELPKYTRIKQKEFLVKVKGDEFGTPLASEFVDEPIGMSPLNYQKELQYAGKTMTDRNTVREFLKDKDASRFNVVISDSLLATLKESKWWGTFGNQLEVSPSLVVENTKLTTGSISYNNISKQPGLIEKVRSLLKKKKSKPVDEIQTPGHLDLKAGEVAIDVLGFFDILKVETGKEEEFVDKIDSYITLLKKAQSLHQTAQSEKLIKMLVNHIYESILSVSKFSHYVTVEELQKLQSKCERVLDIDYISNFGRVIPDNVAALKLEADDLGVFDNYLVLHYNPNGETWSTEEERRAQEAAKRDPVLFGVINHSNKLFKIADWVDLYCDLTWDDIVNLIATEDISKEDLIDKAV